MMEPVASFLRLRRLLVLLLSLLGATMGGATALAERGDFGHSSFAAKNLDLTDATGRQHILDGDATGGEHGAGRGIPNKSEFPSGWSDDWVLHEVSDIATDPAVNFSKPDGRGYSGGSKTVDGIDVKVVVDQKKGRIVTGYSTDIPRNPKK